MRFLKPTAIESHHTVPLGPVGLLSHPPIVCLLGAPLASNTRSSWPLPMNSFPFAGSTANERVLNPLGMMHFPPTPNDVSGLPFRSILKIHDTFSACSAVCSG